MPSLWYEARLGTRTVWTTIRDDLIDPFLLTSGAVVSSVASSSSRHSSTSPAPRSEKVTQATGDYPEPPATYPAIMAPHPYPPTSYARFLPPVPAVEAEMTRERPSVSPSPSRSPSPVARRRRSGVNKPAVTRQERTAPARVRKHAAASKPSAPPRTGGESYPYRCANCGKRFTERYSIKARHFFKCVQSRGNERGVSWDSDPSCWDVGSNRPSGTQVKHYDKALAYYERNKDKSKKEPKGPSRPGYLKDAEDWLATLSSGATPGNIPSFVVRAEKWKKENVSSEHDTKK